MGNYNILIFDEENINYKKGYLENISVTNGFVDCSYIEDFNRKVISSRTTEMYLRISDYEELDNIKLDDTTMKRIAKFNKEQECKRLDKKIEEKKAKIKELDDLLKDKEKRWNKVKKYIEGIYDIDVDDYDEDYEEWD